MRRRPPRRQRYSFCGRCMVALCVLCLWSEATLTILLLTSTSTSPSVVVDGAVATEAAAASIDEAVVTDEIGSMECPSCEAQVASVQNQLQGKLDTTIAELDEIIEERNRQFEEIRQLKQSLHAARQEQSNLRSQLQTAKDNQAELQQRYIATQAQVSALQGELEAAHAEIDRLGELSFLVNFRKELVGLFGKIGHFLNYHRRNLLKGQE